VMEIEQVVAEVQRNLELLTGQEPALPRRHESIRAVFAQSWTLLTAPEQRVLAALAVCRGPFTVAAAAAIAQATPLQLAALLDRSLLHARTGDEVRYEFHELTRHFALQHLVASGALAVTSQRHCAFYLALAEAAEQQLLDSPHRAPAAPLALDRDNFLAALAWSARPTAEPAEQESGLRLIAALWPSWLWRAAWREGRTWLQRLVDRPVLDEPTRGLVRAQRCVAPAQHLDRNVAAARTGLAGCVAHSRTLGDLDELASSLLALSVSACDLGAYVEARQCLAESAALWARKGTRWGLYLVALAQGQIAMHQGADSEAERCFTEGLTQARALGDDWYAIYALHNLLVLKRSQGNRAAAQQHFRTLWRLYERLPNQLPQFHALAAIVLGAYALGNTVAWSAYFVGEHGMAMRLFEEQLAASRAQGDQRLTAWLLTCLGDVMRSSEDFAQAQVLYEESLALFLQLENDGGAALALHGLGYVQLQRGAMAAAQAHFRQALQYHHAAGITWNVADCLVGLAAVAQATGEPVRAVYLLGAAEQLHRRVDVSGAYASPASQPAVERLTATLRSQVSETAWEHAWSAGAQLSEAAAVAAALGE
jgi:tetratricopeptide (TPR) repeat protein